MNDLVFIDTETTGLDPDKQQAYEVAYAVNDGPITSLTLPHDLAWADDFALKVGGYHERGFAPTEDRSALPDLAATLTGATLVGSNPGFDAAFLRKTLGQAPWHHRLVNVAEGGMWLFGWDRPKGLADVSAALRERGFDIPEPDHTAAQDVAATRAIYYALRNLNTNQEN